MAVGFPTKVDYATGDVLSADNMNDLSGTVNLLESAQYAAGKNAIINGDFGINQRAFTSSTTNTEFCFDRWQNILTTGGGTVTASAQTFTPGTAPVAGYEGTNFMRFVTAGQVNTDARSAVQQKIESVRTFAGETVTVSFWAKAATGTPSLALYLAQFFGAGGSPSAQVTTLATKQAITTSWARYSFVVAVPSISGKTIGTSNSDSLQLRIYFSAGSAVTDSDTIGIQNNTFDIWGIQLESASSASDFQTATGTLQGELAACQRYYWRTSNPTAYALHGSGIARSTTEAQTMIYHPISMRIAPTSVEFSTLGVTDAAAFISAISAMTLSQASSQSANVYTSGSSSLTSTRAYFLGNNNSTSGYIAFSAEL